jgi:integrase/recombinase XerC
MLALGATLGLRREEIASAHPRNRSGATLRVVGKNSDERVLPLDDLTASLLHELEVEQGTDSYYFPGRFGGHVHPATVYKWVKARLGGEWSTHNLRHRAATIGLETTGDIRAVQELLGHRSITSTQLYTAVTGARILDVVAATSLGEDSSSRRIAGTPLFATMKRPATDQEKLELAMRLLAEVHSIERVH